MVQVNLMKNLFPLAQAPPVPLEIDKLVCQEYKPDVGKLDGPICTKPKTRRRTRARIKEVKCYEASLHQDDASWPDDGSLSMTSTMHRAKGLYAMGSLNSNARATAAAYSCSTAADFVCYQETKVCEAAREETENTHRHHKWSVSISACGARPKGGPSAGVAVGTRAHIGMKNSFH